MVEFRLNDRSGVPIYRQIQDMIRFRIASGELRPGEQLPTVRALAVALAVNPNTVIRAYTELEREGVLRTEQGTGTFVAASQRVVEPAERQAKIESLCEEFLAQAARYGFSPEETVRVMQGFTKTHKRRK